MPYLILSDIHGNRQALEAVLSATHGRYDRILCLGDLVDYGADPNAVVEWARASLTAIVRGNHDKACAGLETFEHYNPAAQASAAWTRATLTPANIEYLEKLPRGPVRHENFDLVHGSPFEEDEYLISLADAAPMRAYVDAPVTFFGHTHVQGGFLLARGGVKRIVPRWTLQLEPEHFYLINPGSVGQPRDRDPRAAYVLYSPRERVVEYGRVPYDVAGAAEKIRAAGLPEWLAARLWEGV